MTICRDVDQSKTMDTICLYKNCEKLSLWLLVQLRHANSKPEEQSSAKYESGVIQAKQEWGQPGQAVVDLLRATYSTGSFS